MQQPAVLIRLRPLGPWRSGPSVAPGDQDRDSTDSLFRSDRLFSALTLAFADLGRLDEWLDASVHAASPRIRVGSLFPYQGDTLFVTPPKTLWPPPSSLVTSPSPIFLSKLRWSNARFVPVSLIQSLLTGQPALADQWIVDAESACLLRRDRPSSSPFRQTARRRAAVDRLHGLSAAADTIACVEFENNAGLWTAVTYADAEAEATWRDSIAGAFRLLADSGFGGGRRIGWGQVAPPQMQTGTWPHLLLPKVAASTDAGDEGAYWLLSLYSPSENDRIDWKSGDYRLVSRGGRSSTGAIKKVSRLVEEGSVVTAPTTPSGRAIDVAPTGVSHPIYRAGFALAVKLPDLAMLMENITPPAAEEVLAAAEEPSVVPTAGDLAEESSATAETITTPASESSEDL